MRNPPCLVKSDPAPIPSGKKKCAGVLGGAGRFQPGEGPSMKLLREYENIADGSFAALARTVTLVTRVGH